MRRVGPSLVPLLVVAVNAWCADRLTVSKDVHASSGPWEVTLSVNYAYPFGTSSRPPTVFSAEDGFAFRSGDVLTIQYNRGLWCAGTYVSTGTCVDANGYPNHPPANDAPLGTPTVFAPSRYMDKASYPIQLMQLVGTFADARGQIAGTPFKVGNGPVSVTVPAGAVRLQLGSNLYNYYTARDFYTILNVSVSGPAPPVMRPVGALAHLAVAGSWKTTIVLANSDSTAARARLSFFDESGSALRLPLSFPGLPAAEPVETSSFETTLEAGAAVTIESTGPDDQPVQVGSAQLVSDGGVSGFAIFGRPAGGYDQEAVVPLESRGAASYVLWFDNTEGRVVGLALANLSKEALQVAVTVRDENGSALGSGEIPLAAQGHGSFPLPDRLPQTAGRRGTVEFRTTSGGQITVLGLRFNPGAFTTIPVMAK